jgi:hypothetical protein
MSHHATTDYAQPFARALWFDILPRAELRPELPAQVLLHAGPPFKGQASAPVIHAAIQAILFEGMAVDAHAALDLLLRNQVQLQPAQDYGIVTPLAQVVSASMPLAAVELERAMGYAPLVEAPPPALRFGATAPECRERLRVLASLAQSVIAPSIRREPIVVAEIIQVSIAAKEECHARTAAANEALIARLVGLEPPVAAVLRANPAFVLPILMAAAAAALKASECAIAAIGGNGVDFGVRRRERRDWQQMPAEAPRGPRFAGAESYTALGAIGDSAVIDFCGLGGQALAVAPALASEWAALLPPDALSRRERLIDPRYGIVDPERVAQTELAPIINLAVLDREGSAGLIGRGFYCPPVRLFADWGTP